MNNPFRPHSREKLKDEIRHHIAECVDFLVSNGWTLKAAHEEAERRFGDPGRIRRELEAIDRQDRRRRGRMEWMQSVSADIGYALRGIRGNRTYTVALVATLALGIGAASSIFSVVDAHLLRPMPYQDAQRWVEVNQAKEDGSYSVGHASGHIGAWKEASDGLFDGWVAFVSLSLVRTDGDQAEALSVVGVTSGVENLLGFPLLMGRGFTSEDALPGASPVAVLSREYWERIGADPTILGRTLRMESGPIVVVGVYRDRVRFPDYGGWRDMWIPLRDDFSLADRPPTQGVQGLWARIAPGLSVEMAQERADVLAEGLQEQGPSDWPWQVRLIPVGGHRANPDVKRALWILAATVSTLFLIALVNGVNLILVRASTRQREFAVRGALGASRLRLGGLLLVEGVILGLMGSVAAVGLAWAAVAGIRGILPSSLLFFSPHAFEVEGRTLLFAFLSSLLGGMTLGVVPYFMALGPSGTGHSFRGRTGNDEPGRRRVRNGMVVAQMALSMTLLVITGLLVNSFSRLLRVDPGFDYQRIAMATVPLSPTRYPDGPARADFIRRLEEALEGHPAVEAVTMSSGSGFSFGEALEAEGEPIPESQPIIIPNTAVQEDFFTTMGIGLEEGRGVEASDVGTGNVVVDRDLSAFLWGDRSPVRRRFRVGPEGEWWTVVGVVGDLKLMGRDERNGPHQFLVASDPENGGQYVEVAMRTLGSPEALLPVFQETLRALDPEQWIWKLGTASQMLAEEEESPLFMVTLMSLLSAVAVALAAVGLYGVLAYSVDRRRRELGIRLALGADRWRVRRMVLGEGLAVATVGVVLGVVGALEATHLIEKFLYEVPPRDPTTFAATVCLFFAVSLTACLLPSFRATRVDPGEVLREE